MREEVEDEQVFAVTNSDLIVVAVTLTQVLNPMGCTLLCQDKPEIVGIAFRNNHFAPTVKAGMFETIPPLVVCSLATCAVHLHHLLKFGCAGIDQGTKR
jgi:hypothetical protein